MKGDDIGASYSFSYEAVSSRHEFYETPQQAAGITIPLDAFRHASTMQVVARYLVDVQGFSFSAASRMLGRSPKSIWASYHQTGKLPALEQSLAIPIAIFSTSSSPLESLVSHLKSLGLRNVEIAKALNLSPKTVWTAAKRAEVRS